MGEAQNQHFRLSFNPKLKVEFQGSRVTSWFVDESAAATDEDGWSARETRAALFGCSYPEKCLISSTQDAHQPRVEEARHGRKCKMEA